MKKELRFERVENPEGWVSIYGFKVAYICSNISREAATWIHSDTPKEQADQIIAEMEFPLQFYDRQGDWTATPTIDDVIWPRFGPVEVDGGWSVLDEWRGKRRDKAWLKSDVEYFAEIWNNGSNGEPEADVPDLKWIPYTKPETPNIPETPEQRYARVAPEVARRLVEDEIIEEETPVAIPAARFVAEANPNSTRWDSPHYWGVMEESTGQWAPCKDGKDEAIAVANRLNRGHQSPWDDLVWLDRKANVPETPDSSAQPDPINPDHYKGEIECIDAIRVALGDEGLIAYCRGNAIKYHWRAGDKGPQSEDCAKAAWYSQMAAHVAEPEKYADPRNKGKE